MIVFSTSRPFYQITLERNTTLKKIDQKQFIFDDNGQNFYFKLETTQEDGILRLKISMDFNGKIQPKKTTLTWRQPALRADGIWTSCGVLNRWLTPDWGPQRLSFRSASEYPVMSILSFDDRNVCTIGSLDAETPTCFKVGYREERSELLFTVEWFVETMEEMNGYQTELTLDTRAVHFAECISRAKEELGKRYALTAAPKEAYAPVFSTWYCFHQEVYRERLLKECRLAKELGLETVIIDDGWQSDDNNRGYGFSGDYFPAQGKVGDIKTLTKEINQMGMKSMLWLSLAFSGDYTKGAEKFQKMSLYHDDGLHASVVDPRFFEVRKHIVTYCRRAVEEWGFDGLKLDFIDSFRLTEQSAVREGVDCPSLEEGIRLLIEELNANLKEVKENVLIEFRQSYIGPAMQQLGNMLRVGDCPGSLLANRIASIDLRLIASERAVHADPLEWNENETPEYIATAFSHTVFSVLQFSVFPSELKDEQRKVCVRYIRFMKEYEDVLLHGDLLPRGVLSNYLSCKAVKGNRAVEAIYAPVLITLQEDETILLNGSSQTAVAVRSNCTYRYSIEDCYGDKLEEGTMNGNALLTVPVGGIVFFDKL